MGVIAKRQSLRIGHCRKDFAGREFKVEKLGEIAEYQYVAVQVDQPRNIEHVWQQYPIISHVRLSRAKRGAAKNRFINRHNLQSDTPSKSCHQMRKNFSRCLRNSTVEHFQIDFSRRIEVG